MFSLPQVSVLAGVAALISLLVGSVIWRVHPTPRDRSNIRAPRAGSGEKTRREQVVNRPRKGSRSRPLRLSRGVPVLHVLG